MSRTNGKSSEDVYDENVVVVSSPTSLPFSYIPYGSVNEARAKANAKDSGLDPNKTLYVYEGRAPAGYKIVAYPIHMTDPDKKENGHA